MLYRASQTPQIKDINLVMQDHYTFMASNRLFIALGIPDGYFEKTKRIKSILFPGAYKSSLNTSSPAKLLSLHSRQTNRVKNEVDGQPSSLLVYMEVSDYKAAFTLMHYVFLELDTHHHPLDFKLRKQGLIK